MGRATRGITYDRLRAFTLFLEDGYRMDTYNGNLPGVVPEALMSAMFEAAYRDLCATRRADRLLAALPYFTYTIIAPFLGPKAAMAFIEEKVQARSSTS